MTTEFRIKPDRPRTMRDVWNEQGGGVRRRSSESLRQDPREFKPEDHVFRKPAAKRKPCQSLIVPEAEVTCAAEILEGCDTRGRLGIVLRFLGIEFASPSVFERGRGYYGDDSRVFFSRIRYRNESAFLIIATYGDIVEFQVVETRINERPFFREERFLPKLTVTYDPNSMTVREKNRLVVVNYDRL